MIANVAQGGFLEKSHGRGPETQNTQADLDPEENKNCHIGDRQVWRPGMVGAQPDIDAEQPDQEEHNCDSHPPSVYCVAIPEPGTAHLLFEFQSLGATMVFALYFGIGLILAFILARIWGVAPSQQAVCILNKADGTEVRQTCVSGQETACFKDLRK